MSFAISIIDSCYAIPTSRNQSPVYSASQFSGFRGTLPWAVRCGLRGDCRGSRRVHRAIVTNSNFVNYRLQLVRKHYEEWVEERE